MNTSDKQGVVENTDVENTDVENWNIENINNENLSTRINTALQATQAENYDPVRFAFIRSLVQRLNTPHHASNDDLREKVRNGVREYMTDFEGERTAARYLVADISGIFDDYSQAANDLFERSEFKQLLRLSAVLKNRTKQRLGRRALRELNSDLDAGSVNAIDRSVDGEQLLSLDDLLDQQQAEAVSISAETPLSKLSEAQLPPRPLRSMKLHAESTKRFNVDQAIARSISDTPQNPGPHNPQMLAIDALSQMRDLSPKYLRRLANYIDTLAWLEKPGLKLCDKSG